MIQLRHSHHQWNRLSLEPAGVFARQGCPGFDWDFYPN